MNAPLHPVVDWPLLLEELRLTGLTFRQLAEQTEVSHVTLVKYANHETCPTHANGERLIEVWRQFTSKARENLPMTVTVKVVRLRA